MIRFLGLAAALTVPTLLHAHDAPVAGPAAGAPKRVIIKTIKHMPDGSAVENAVENPEVVRPMSCKEDTGAQIVRSEHVEPDTKSDNDKRNTQIKSVIMICAKSGPGDVSATLEAARKHIENDVKLSAGAKKAALEAIDKAIADQSNAK